MKVRKIKVWLALTLVPLVYNSCNEEKLDLLPGSETEASYFVEELQFEKANLGIYAKLHDFYWFRANNPMHPLWLLPGDDITSSGNWATENFSNLNPSDDRNGDHYRQLYRLINRTNVMLQKIAEVKDGVYKTPGLKDFHRGEALFFRAWANFRLWNYYGTPPLITERIQSTDKITPSNSAPNELLNAAIADFQAAEALLPASWEAKNRGRVTKSSANGFIGKALVFRATVTKNTADYTAAITAFNKITDKSLMPNFLDNFDKDKENNAESLFEFQASAAGGENVWLANDFDNPIGSLSAAYNYYENNPGNNYNPYLRGTLKLFNAFDPLDPRRDLTVKANLTDASPANDYQIQKYWTKDQKVGGGAGSANNTRILRYADVLLLKAEALVQSGGSTTEAIGLINQVRARARNSSTVPSLMPLDRPVTTTDRATIMDWIREERFLELAGEEGHRWLDLRRWHLGGQINLANFDFSSVNSAAQFDVNKNLYFPIPNNEIDLNPNIVQNPNY